MKIILIDDRDKTASFRSNNAFALMKFVLSFAGTKEDRARWIEMHRLYDEQEEKLRDAIDVHLDHRIEILEAAAGEVI